MLSDQHKKAIQSAYSQFLAGRGLRARYGQKLMVAAIARTLGAIRQNASGERDSGQSDGDHICVVEAGTGTGKTVAYLLASIPLAQARGKTLVVSTATVALQEQIINKDLPEVARHSGLEFDFILAKGRGRYLCLSKLDQLLSGFSASGTGVTLSLYGDEQPLLGEDTVLLYREMADKLATGTWDGDRDNWPETLDAEDWSRITTDHRQCSGRRCPHVGNCSFFRARDSLGKAQVIVANHDLLLADLALGGGAILPPPEETIYVLDEAHHLPDKALNHFSHHSRVGASSGWLEQANKSLGQMLGEIGDGGDIDRCGEQLPAVLTSAKQGLEQMWPLIEELCEFEADGGSSYSGASARHRFEGGVVPEPMMQLAEKLREDFDELESLLGKMLQAAQKLLEDPHSPVPAVDLERWYPQLGSWYGRAEANLQLWANYARPDADGALPQARWVTLVDWGGSHDFEVCSSPILAARTLEYSLWRRCYGAVLTSATLTALGKFDRLKLRAGTPDNASYQVVPSPFDFSRAVLRVPACAVDAGDADAHTNAVIDTLPDLLQGDGGALVLFSSRRQMETVYEALPGTWRNRILMQGQRSRQQLLETHRDIVDGGGSSVLFGLASFAEGLDLPGDYCRHVVIAKLPFAVPDDPIEAALAEWIEARGGNPFMQITVPDAALKLVQACGRLLRTEADSGTVTLLDRRVVTRRYGRAILDSLPPFTRRIE
ncbi:ATP-dependent DNA helicase DinG [Microbulbifer thermotolerans]|uniref:ATP-dependent DNA helicase DinG n=1 Tax=Microbulbifer thermotolerans TaxID=252514 RepID=UPI0008E4F438|nr:ATP-dependent DNA helicase DinG [Microbulbifer thermotolerans]MCX2779077.1 ATP-dependent DNA helicase DinG [Microbulbifer thermotolerans]MCX2784346.1 ATP-dependent DNA helicase DinG [Microbulbifer thermotolerans]MCX2804626.1 ATP-dependent DNA helicase DinG [Microbulbifer thermotolerans]MCX2835857.1 ATP-dependent DNA helicase DinG [Microbulbifer thermotolerans]MCX2842920.1 ATP-dependent DNA helicase DinG [Microbulbifer thermotolerans]